MSRQTRRGLQSIIIDQRDFLAGMTTNEFTNDGGFSPSSSKINIIAEPGVVHGSPPVNDRSINLLDEIIATTHDPNYLGHDRIIVDDSGAAYTFDGATLTLRNTTSVTSSLFASHKSSLVFFNGNWYMTRDKGSGVTQGDIVRWSGADLNTRDDVWWTSTSAQSALGTTVWRPLLVWEKNMWIGDANNLHKVDTGGTITTNQLTLEQTDVISALGKDTRTGYMLIATSGGIDASATNSIDNKLMIYDGSSKLPLKIIPVPKTVTAIKNLGENTFIFYGRNVGLFTNSGIKFLRRLNIDYDFSELIYPNKAAQVDRSLLIAEGKKVLALTEIMPEKFIWSYVAAASFQITAVFPLTKDKFGFSYATAKFNEVDLSNTSSYNANGAGIFYSRRYRFPQDIYIRNIRLEWTRPPSASTKYGNLDITYLDNDYTGRTVLFGIKNVNQEIETPPLDIRTREFYLSYTFDPATSSNVAGIKRIEITYDPAF